MEKEQSGNMAMLHSRSLLMILCVLFIVSGCAKDGGVCVSSTGQIIQQVRNIPDYTEIDIRNNVNLILSTDSVNKVIVEAGQNIIGGVTTKVVNGQLLISNNSKCNWLRDYSRPVNVYISNSKLWKITYNGSGNITTAGTLKQDSLNIQVWGGCGTIELTVDLWQGSFSLIMGTVDYKLHGVSAITSVYMNDYGLYDARDMKTGYTFITSKGSNDGYVQAVNYLEATITSIGNIYYLGDPKSVKVTRTGAGDLLPL